MQGKSKTQVWVVENQQTIYSHLDNIAIEEPLEMRLVYPQKTIAITMRTPGNDFELGAGFLFTEGIINQPEDIQKISYCLNQNSEQKQEYNILNIELKSELQPNLVNLERHFFTNSACGVCGKTSIEALKITIPSEKYTNKMIISSEIIYSLSEQLRLAQGLFTATGGLHAAALFDTEGKLLKLREDIGRHNALDKLIGSAFLAQELPLKNHIIMVSGRTSFEILQKSIKAGVSIICGISAPSSLAISLAQEFHITLIGFLRGKKFNIYSGMERISHQI